MRFRFWFAMATCMLAAGGGIDPSSSWGQEDVLIPAPPQGPGKHVEFLNPYRQGLDVTVRFEPMNQLQQAAAKIRDAQGDSAKSAAREELTALLDQYFEDDMARRAKELSKVEERVKKLRSLLEKRKSKKQQIIDLQIKVLENEADGLGFFNSAQAPGQPGSPMLVRPFPASSADSRRGEFHFSPEMRENTNEDRFGGRSASATSLAAPQPMPSPTQSPASGPSRNVAPSRQEESSSGNRFGPESSTDEGESEASVPVSEAVAPN